MHKTIEKYSNKPLAVRNYKSPVPVSYVKDFLDRNNLLYVLYEYNCGEVEITDDGFRFLHEYYGEDELVNMIKEEIKNGVDYSFQNEQEIKKWLRNTPL